MARAGFSLEIHDTDQLGPIRLKTGIAPALAGCHTAFVDGYAIEGHVPPTDVLRLLKEKPAARGLAVPGMPSGSPGMPVLTNGQPFDTLLIEKDGRSRIFAPYG